MTDRRVTGLGTALDMYEFGEQMCRARLRRQHPEASEDEVDDMLRAWRLDRLGAPHGDAPGEPSARLA